MTTLKGNWNYPTLIRFGAGRIRELPDACRTLGMQRPLIVTDPSLAKLPMIANAVAILKEAGLGGAVFSTFRRTPSKRMSRMAWRRFAAARMTG